MEIDICYDILVRNVIVLGDWWLDVYRCSTSQPLMKTSETLFGLNLKMPNTEPCLRSAAAYKQYHVP